MNEEATFDLAAYLGGEVFPHSRTFEDGPLQGFSVTYRDLPGDWKQQIIAHIGLELGNLGFNPQVAVQSFYADTEATGEELIALEQALEALDASMRERMEAILRDGWGYLLSKLVGSWNANMPLSVQTLAMLPNSIKSALFVLAATVTITPDREGFLGKPPPSSREARRRAAK